MLISRRLISSRINLKPLRNFEHWPQVNVRGQATITGSNLISTDLRERLHLWSYPFIHCMFRDAKVISACQKNQSVLRSTLAMR